MTFYSPAETRADSVVILDFETSGLSPNQGDRAIEIGAVKLTDGVISATFQSLMNPGFRVSRFIEDFTGISNAMLADAPPSNEVMAEFARFIAGEHLVAHNASFDKRFLDTEFARSNLHYQGEFTCSLLIARRLQPEAPSHKLGELVRYKHIEHDGTFHRALADAQMTAGLWLALLDELQQSHISAPTFAMMQTISKTAKNKVPQLLQRWRS